MSRVKLVAYLRVDLPASSALVEPQTNPEYREGRLNANFAITDTGRWLLQGLVSGQNIARVSRLGYLVILHEMRALSLREVALCMMPNAAGRTKSSP